MSIVRFRLTTLSSQSIRKTSRRRTESKADSAGRAELHRMLDEILNLRNHPQRVIRENVEYAIEVIRGGGALRT